MKLIKRRGLAGKLGVCVDTTYERLNPKSPHYDAEFPKPISMTETSRAKFFIEEEVDAYIAKKAARREQVMPNPGARRSPRRPAEASENGAGGSGDPA